MAKKVDARGKKLAWSENCAISRKNMTRGGGLLMCFVILGLFLGYKTFLSPQKVSGSSKNSYRKLRVYTFRS